MITDTDSTIRQIEFELEKAEHGMALPFAPERVGNLRTMLVEARKRKLSDGLAERRRSPHSATVTIRCFSRRKIPCCTK
jgi:hypothetical protein